MDICQAARKLRPGTAWTYNGTTLTQAIDDCPRVSVPTPEELKAVMESDEYKERRRAEYPPLEDYLDALYHQSLGDDAKLTAYWNAVSAVKTKYPKP